MKKFFMVLCVVMMFFGIVGCPSSDDPGTTSSFKSISSTPVAATGADTSGGEIHATPEPTTIVLLGSGLVGIVAFGRKKFKK